MSVLPCACLVPVEVSKAASDPLELQLSPMLPEHLGPLEEQLELLTVGASLQVHTKTQVLKRPSAQKLT